MKHKTKGFIPSRSLLKKSEGLPPTTFLSKSGGGFTLIELTVVVGMIIAVTGVVLMNYRQTQRNFELGLGAQKVAQDIHRAREMAIRAEPYTANPNQNECAGGASISPGYGVHFTGSSASYILFANCNASLAYDPGIDETVQTIQLESAMRIQGVSPSPLSIFFESPDPAVWFNGVVDPLGADGLITLEQSGKTKDITVKRNGLVEVQ